MEGDVYVVAVVTRVEWIRGVDVVVNDGVGVVVVDVRRHIAVGIGIVVFRWPWCCHW